MISDIGLKEKLISYTKFLRLPIKRIEYSSDEGEFHSMIAAKYVQFSNRYHNQFYQRLVVKIYYSVL